MLSVFGMWSNSRKNGVAMAKVQLMKERGVVEMSGGIARSSSSNLIQRPVFGCFPSALGKQCRALHVELISQDLYLKGLSIYQENCLRREGREGICLTRGMMAV